ncbi:MAG: ATP-binding protein [Sulfuricella sp.]
MTSAKGTSSPSTVNAVRVALLYLVFASLWILASDHLLNPTINDPDLLIWISQAKGILFVVVTALLLYLLLRGRSAGFEASPRPAPKVRYLVGVFLGLALIVISVAYGVVRMQAPRIQAAAQADLAAIAEMKTGQIEAWLGERWADAEVLAESTSFIEHVERWRLTGDANAGKNFRNRLDTLRRVEHYDIELLDTQGHRMLAGDARPDTLDLTRTKLLPEALQTGKVQVSELYRDRLGGVRLDYVVPLILSDAGVQRRIGAVVLRAPVEGFLFPLVQSWPTSSPSAETVLARRDGDSVLFLNDLRHRKITAFSYRLPLDSAGLPAAMAISSGQAQTLEGIDYRGVPVLAAVRPVNGTSWFLVAKVDRSEMLAPLNKLGLAISLVALVAVGAVAAAVLMLWRQQLRTHGLELAAQAAEKDQQIKLFYDLPFIGMSITSPPSKHFLHVNDCLCEMLGYSRDELQGLTWSELTHPDDLAANITQFERMLAGEIDGFQLEKRFIRKDGTVIDARLDGRAVRSTDGTVELMVATVQDITESKRAEEKIRQLNAELEQRVVERTAQLEALNKELESFTYSVSHDLKAPLRGIDGYSRLLLHDHAAQLDEEGRLFLANVRQGAQQMSGLIDDLLAYSRLERRAMEPVRILPGELARTVVAEREGEIRERGAAVTVDIPDEAVRADRDGLAMVLRNLLDNALKFTRDAAEPCIEIGGRTEDDRCILWVKDNGIGFDMKFHDRIFEIFQRLQRAEDYPGTGVGLAIVRKAMQRMDGRAWAESAPGQGATFYLELPK